MRLVVIALAGLATVGIATPICAQTTAIPAPVLSGESRSPGVRLHNVALDSGVRRKAAEDFGPPDLTISGTVRLRYELLEGQYRPGLPPHDDGVFIQTAIAAEYRTGDWRFGAELVDARAYAVDAPGALATSEVNALELSRAYIARDFGDVTLTAGRFHLNLGSRRLSARNAFRNTINAFTGLRLDWQGARGDHLVAFYSLPHSRLPDDRAGLINNRVRWDRESFDLSFWGAHYTRPDLIDGIRLEANLFGLHERDGDNRPTRNRQLMTAGARLFRAPQPGHWDIDAEGALQLGTIRASTAADAARQDVRAYFFHAELGRSFDLAFRPRMSAMFDIASGDDPRSSRFSRFDTLFGARRWELGPTGIFGPLARTNIVAPGLRFEAAPAKGWDVMALWRPTWLHSRRDRFGNTALADASGQAGRFVGHMLEARIGHWLVDKRVRIEAGTALLTNGAVRRSAPNAPRFRDTRYGYGQLTFSF